MVTTDLGQTIVQPVLADLLNRIGDNGTSAFYEGAIAAAISHRCREAGGFLTDEDFARHESVVTASIGVDWRGGRVLVQPPMSTGVLLAMMLQGFETQAEIPQSLLDHACIELTEAAFEFRDRVGDGTGLLGKKLDINLDRASRRGGPRSYLHTAGVAVADADGLVVSSLASVFDDFGSAIYVPEGGFVLNNRAEGFTNPPNDPAPGKRPVHTLAPALVESDHGVMALATPGADGQVQTLLQILVGLAREGLELDAVIDRPRWRSEQGRLLIDRSHEQAETLRELGHDLVLLDDGDKRFGGVVCAGRSDTGPFAVSDWRRQVCSGVI
ncbi:MAG: hypothetical protein GY791_05685 [Alphaproteobacteria bacterium]|nr:hypothetical protein [Alphaproteobacteria bacterium]